MIISASTVRAELVHYTSSYNKYMQQKAKLHVPPNHFSALNNLHQFRDLILLVVKFSLVLLAALFRALPDFIFGAPIILALGPLLLL